MATKKIVVDPTMLTNASKSITSVAGEYVQTYNSLFTEVDNMGRSWKGQDNTDFVAHIGGFKKDFEDMKLALDDYAKFLSETSKRYADAQSEIAAAAKKLTN
ncbi:WXG100 family type VII secretion target [Paenibacillus sp. GCM10027627]|uniref:WXG100 family type VII secretion target n=1 Tax=unclassified Paenibacillus TaxID=185978 RepID=UPI00363972B9